MLAGRLAFGSAPVRQTDDRWGTATSRSASTSARPRSRASPWTATGRARPGAGAPRDPDPDGRRFEHDVDRAWRAGVRGAGGRSPPDSTSVGGQRVGHGPVAGAVHADGPAAGPRACSTATPGAAAAVRRAAPATAASCWGSCAGCPRTRPTRRATGRPRRWPTTPSAGGAHRLDHGDDGLPAVRLDGLGRGDAGRGRLTADRAARCRHGDSPVGRGRRRRRPGRGASTRSASNWWPGPTRRATCSSSAAPRSSPGR